MILKDFADINHVNSLYLAVKMAERASSRNRRPPHRLGWESDHEVFMDSDSDLSEHEQEDSDAESEAANNYSQDTHSSVSQRNTETETETESDSDTDSDPEWIASDDNQPDIPPFTGDSGLRNLPNHPMDCMDYFYLFLGEDFFDLLVAETNRYATQFIRSQLFVKANSRVNDWKPTTVAELKCFVALLLAMGLDDRPTYECYWATSPIFQTPFWSSIMTRNRFQLIMKFFHLVDNSAHDPTQNDKLWKLRPIVDRLQTAFPHFYVPEKDVSIDETMVAFTGRLQFKQYIPIKPQKYGIKVSYTIHFNFRHKLTQTITGQLVALVISSPMMAGQLVAISKIQLVNSSPNVVSLIEIA